MISTSTIIVLLCLVSSFYCINGLSTSGNRILDKSGNAVLLRGVNRPSFEWNSKGESSSLQDYQLMKNWGSNIVRLPLNQAFWLSGAVTYSSSYASIIDQQVTWIKSLGMYVILDLHWSDQGNLGLAGDQQNMADTNSITFWSQVAAKYKNDEMVLFELYNEPHDVSWSVWRNGGSASFTVGGMQQMFNAIRATGANNVIIVGGLNWAYDLSGVTTGGYAITGTNIAYATHPYDYPGKQASDWDVGFGNLAATYPVIMTEFGQYCAQDSYVADLLAYATKKGIHWTAWAWYVSGCEFPSIISDWQGTPSTIGAIVKNYLSSTAPSVPSTTSVIAPTAAPASASANSGFSIPSQAQIIYDDQAQNGWLDWSWATVAKSTSLIFSGSNSIAFTLGPYTAVYFHNPTPFAVGSFASLQFSVNGGSISPSNIVVKLYDTSATPAPIGNALSLPIAVQANKWITQTISLSSFSLAPNTKVSGVVILYNQNNNGGVIYLDNIALLPVVAVATAAPVAPTAAPVAPHAAVVAPTAAPVAPTEAPVAPTEAPVAPTAAPVAPTTAPVAPTTAPVAPTAAPVAPTAAPVAPTAAPVAPTAAPVRATAAPVRATTAPTAAPVRATTVPTSVRGALYPTLSPTIRPIARATAVPGVVGVPVVVSTAADTFGDSGSKGGCSATSIVISQSLVNSWHVGGDVMYQYTTALTNLCSNKKVISLTLAPTSNWNPVQFWNIEANGELLVTPSYITIAANDAFTNFGYQNKGGMATFTVKNVVFA